MRLPITLLVFLPVAALAQKAVDPLPITRVALYKNGVGFFEHTGRVTGDQSVSIDFTSAQLNDVLQSLTAIDLNGGRISGAGYNSTTPLDQQLKALPLGLSENASDLDFYNAIRGARVQVAAPGVSISGRLLSIDLRLLPSKDGATPITDHRYVTVVSEAGQVRTIELTPAVSVALLDTALHLDVNHYLELLANNRNERLRHLTLLDRGTGSRELHVSYISEVPVWKSTYRLLLSTGAADATLQGWSVVDNTTGSDWTNVHLDLIAGAPQSFIQPISTPYYARRPEIPLPAEAQLAPQTHDSGDMENGHVSGMIAGGAPPPEAAASPFAASQSVTVNSGPEVAGGPVDRFTGGTFDRAERFAKLAAPINYTKLAEVSITPQTTTSAFDDYFQYSLTDPITIRKNESALVPILQTRLPIERVTLWSPQQPTALRALWLTNNSRLTLDRGSFSIVENGSFGGEGLLDPIHPDEKRLLSYAADQAVRVTPDFTNDTSRVTHLTVKKGVLTETSTEVHEVEYLVHNAAPDARTVIIEQPARQGWTLDSEVKPTETTPTANRFRVETKPAETVRLQIGERHTNSQYIRLVDQSEDQLALLLHNAKASPATMTALQPVFDAHNAVVTLDKQIQANQAEANAITADQARLRENMKALKGTAEERDLLKRYTGELNQQEDQLATLRTQLAQLQTQRNTADMNFQAKLEAVNLDESL